MIMGMRCTYCTLFKFNLDEHYLTVVSQNLTNNAFSGGFPCFLVFENECIASCSFHCVNDNFTDTNIAINNKFEKP